MSKDIGGPPEKLTEAGWDLLGRGALPLTVDDAGKQFINFDSIRFLIKENLAVIEFIHSNVALTEVVLPFKVSAVLLAGDLQARLPFTISPDGHKRLAEVRAKLIGGK